MPLLALLLAAQDADALIASARGRIAVTARCVLVADATDVTVCGRRGADRYRVPFVTRSAGAGVHDSAAAERTALLHRTTPVEDMGPFQVESGMAGVSTGVAFGGPGAGHVDAEGLRPLAP